MSKLQSRWIGVVVASCVLVVLGCGGASRPPVQPAGEAHVVSPEGSSSEAAVGPAQTYLGDMDGDHAPTANDAQLIMEIIADPDSHDVAEKYIADCAANSKVELGDALKVLRAAAGAESWPFAEGGPPPPPPI